MNSGPPRAFLTAKATNVSSNKHGETLLRHTVKIRRLKLIDVIHQEAIRKIAVDMDVQLPTVRIYECCQRADYADGGQVSARFPALSFAERRSNRSSFEP